MFIYELYELSDKNKFLLSAPPGFGKSVNSDMVKRFLEQEIDENGEPKVINTTSNYDLFVTNNLQITKKETFFNRHFGKYPVMYIDYSVLCGVNSFASMLLHFRNILKDIFWKNKYLLKNPKLWVSEEEKELFSNYFYNNNTLQSRRHILTGLKWLSKLLFKHFNQLVFVVIDEFDTFLNSLPQKRTFVEKDIISFVSAVQEDLFKDNKFIFHALIMGDNPISEDSVLIRPNNIPINCVLYDDFFWKYFGITEKELEELLSKLVKDDDERKKLKFAFDEDARKIKRTYKQNQIWEHYRFFKRPKIYKLYSFNPLINYLKNKTKFENQSEQTLNN